MKYVKEMISPNMFEIDFNQVKLAGGIPFYLSFLQFFESIEYFRPEI